VHLLSENAVYFQRFLFWPTLRRLASLRLCFNCNICLHGLRVSLCYLFTIHFAALEKLHMLHPYFGSLLFRFHSFVFLLAATFYVSLEFVCVV